MDWGSDLPGWGNGAWGSGIGAWGSGNGAWGSGNGALGSGNGAVWGCSCWEHPLGKIVLTTAAHLVLGVANTGVLLSCGVQAYGD